MKNFVFDIDGTLIDSAEVDGQAFWQTMAEYGYSFTREQLAFSFGMSGRKVLEALGIPAEQVEGIMTRWEQLSYARLQEVAVFDGVAETLAALRAAGARLGIVTSRTRKQLREGFSPIGLDSYFDAIVCSDEIAQPKPAPDGLRECIRRLGGTAAETVYIGDTAYDMQCARAAGAFAMLALWGCHAPEQIDADTRCVHPKELLRLL